MPAVLRLAGWKYKEGTTDEQKLVAKDGLIRLYTDLAHLVNHDPIGGKNTSKLGLNKGLDIAFTVEFKSEEARDEFDTNPMHETLVKEFGQFVEDIFIFDLVKDDYGL
ncbi:hypothetical protein PENSPDRAFT_758279 [Peniophora sp. CONT]|nr:hypothetical protein PENSPDRAFT_758279 [Peniophora sp. CONT]